MLVCVWSNFCQDGRWFEGFGVRSAKAAQFSGRGARLVQTFDMSRRDNNGTNKSNIQSQGLDHHVKKGSVARVDRRLRRYYLIVRLLPNVFALACLSLSSI